MPSAGQSNSKEARYQDEYLIYSIHFQLVYSLEQSNPCLPVSQEHSPVVVSQLPELLQSPGQVSSEIRNHYLHMMNMLKDAVLPEQSKP